MSLRVGLPVLLIAVVLASVGCTKQAAAPIPQTAVSPVKVSRAEARTLPLEVRVIGNVEAYKTISVKSQVGGLLVRAAFREGDPVRKGQLLFQIDPRPFEETVRQWEANLGRDRALLKQAEANLARDQAQEKFAREQAGRYEELAKEGVFSRQQRDQATSDADSRRQTLAADQAAIESARAAVRADESALENARLQLSYCTIYSPIDGRTGNIAIKEGNLVKANDLEMVSIMQIQPVYVTFPVPEKQLPAVRARAHSAGLRVIATPQAPGAVASTGSLTFIDNMVDPTTGTIRLKATFSNAVTTLWPGQFADVVLTLGEQVNAVTIPVKAIQTSQSGSFVYVVKPDQTVEMRTVVPGLNAGSDMEVKEGLAAGETVVTEGHIRLAPGAHVKVQS